MALSAAGLILTAMHEGYSDKPYMDLGGIWTNGFGNTVIEPEKTVTVTRALQDLSQNMQKAQDAVNRCVNVTMSQHQYDAYVDFTYNVGANAFCKSSIAKYANQGRVVDSCQSIMKYVYVAGKDCRNKANKCYGIVKRREEERKLCLS